MITIHNTSEKEIWNKSSEFLVNWLRVYHNTTAKTLLLLSGGSAVNLYRNLKEFIGDYRKGFNNLALGQVDDRKFKIQNAKIKMTNQNSKLNKDINAELIGDTGLWKACEDKGIPYYLISQGGTLKSSAEKYNRVMGGLFKKYVYKIAVMGVGEDGHTAGLLPGYSKSWDREKYVAGYETEINSNVRNQMLNPNVKSLNLTTNSRQFRKRISLTPFALRQLDQAIVVATGKRKMGAIERIMNYELGIMEKVAKGKEVTSNKINEFPAAILREIPQVDLFTDIDKP